MTLYANRYRVIKELGSGITGRVYLVKDEKLSDIERALKVLHSPLGHIKQPELESFQHEFEILKDFCHPSIAGVFDTGLLKAGPLGESKHFYIVTEFIKGKDLFEFTEERSIEIIEDLFVQALRALNYLHSKKVIHLDIKPQNMLVVEKDEKLILKLIDFGFANFYQRKFIRSAEGDLLTAGTTPYVSPEAIKLESLPDYRADLYSLGCTFYKVLTREVPFSGNSVSEIHDKHLYETPRSPSTLNRHIPEYLDKIILTLLQKNPGDRYLSAQEVIKDLNILSGKSYPIEIPETNISYLPQVGKLIGRDLEFEKFKNLYADRIYLKEFKKKPYLIIKGKDGVGKTRFVEECKNYAQAHFVKTMSWKEFKSYGMAEDVPAPCLVLADDISFNASDIESAEVFLSDLPILVIFSASSEQSEREGEAPAALPMEGATRAPIIELENFTKEQVKEYITQATGLSSIPEPLLDTIYKITKGNPLYLTEYLRALFEEGFLRDSQGSWSPQILEDLGSQFNALGAAAFIKKRLNQKISSLHLNENKWQLLGMLALFGKPTLQELEELTNAEAIDEELRWLVSQGILEIDATGHHVFSNPVYEEIILEKIDPTLKAELCDTVANYLERQSAPREQILYYRGRSASPHAFEYLLELAHNKREETDYQEAKKNLLYLVNNSPPPPLNSENYSGQVLRGGDRGSYVVYHTALLELGEICIEVGKYEEAEEWLLEIILYYETSKIKPLFETYVRALEQMGVSFYRIAQYEQATNYYHKALEAIKNKPEFLWMEVFLKNKLARNYFDKGDIKKAEEIFLETWAIWKNKLNKEEKIKAIRSDIDQLYNLKGEYEKSIYYLKEFLKVLSEFPSNEDYPFLLYKLATPYQRMDQLHEAEKIINECLQLIKTRKTPYWLYMAYNTLGMIYAVRKDYQQALDHYQHAFQLARKTGTSEYEVKIAYNMATNYFVLGRFEDAKKYLNYTINRFESIKITEPTSLGYLFLAILTLTSIDRQQKQIEAAKVHFEKASQLFNKHDFLKRFQQSYLQEKSGLKKLEGNEINFKKIKDEIEDMRNKTEFREDDYQDWLKTL